MKAKGASGPTHSMKEGASRSFSFIEPMKALPVERLPEGDWLYEIKHDGYRALAFKDGKDVRYLSRYFGSLLVGNQSPVGLMFAGRVGTGFSDKVLANLYAKFQKLRAPSCPFVNLPEKTRGRWGLGITPAVMKRCQWVKPVLVAQVKFTEWTHDAQLRQPVFLGLRTDKEAKDVVRE